MRSNHDRGVSGQCQRWFLSLLPQWLAQGIPPWRCLAIILAAHKKEEPERLSRHRQSSLSVEFSTRYDIPFLQEEPVESAQVLSYYPRAISFLDGASKVTQIMWPPVFLSLFFYDTYQYVKFPNDRYRLTLSDFIWGIPRNYNYQYAALSANLGGDIPAMSRWNYWPWTFLVSAALVVGLINCTVGRRDFMGRHLINSDGFFKRIQGLLTIGTASLYLESDQFKNFSQKLRSNQWNWFIKIHAAALLADIAYYEKSDQFRTLAVAQLHELAALQAYKSPFVSIYANYKLWGIGRSKKIGSHLFFYSMITPIRLFAQIRLWSLILNKVIDFIHFEQNKRQCHAENKIWHDIPERGYYDCTVCDETFVDYRSSLLGQGCLNALLASPRDSHTVLSQLRTLKNHGPFSTLDFSQQTWTE